MALYSCGTLIRRHTSASTLMSAHMSVHTSARMPTRMTAHMWCPDTQIRGGLYSYGSI